MAKTLKDFTHAEQLLMPYESVLALRRDAYSAHVAAMAVDPRLVAWADRMRAAHGPRVAVWFNGKNHKTGAIEFHTALQWIEALMVVRYGEEPVPHWPTEFSEADVRRAERWEGGDRPEGVTYVTVEG